MNKAEMLTAMAKHTGLTRNTIKDLIKQGWTYEERSGEPSKFVGPITKARS